ncbi:MAG TPA: aspartate--tRNA ligase [Prolixibacteraceae bacterium]|nr:aspartate--tRNA ligase [Prolixibacteraceae bacterium]
MYRTHTCGELRIANINQQVTLAGWVQRIRDLGAMTFIDLRDRYGITQLVADNNATEDTLKSIQGLGREFVIQVTGTVRERSSKNANIPTGEIEIDITSVTVLNASVIPPFTIQDDTDGGDELRMKYRYLDLRRNAVKQNIELRHKMAQEVRKYFDEKGFLEIETPVLMKSTPEGARDFVVPSRLNPGTFYALPQSPQTFKQILMVAGYDRYFQIVKCFRDEDLRADRQPEFTQIDCEMSFVEQEDILNTFEGMLRHLFKTIKGVEFDKPFLRMTFEEAMNNYGNDKPDLRFDMKIKEITNLVKGKGFSIFDQAAYIGGICATGAADYSRKQIDELTEWVKRPQIGAKGLIYIRFGADGIKSSIDKFFSPEELAEIGKSFEAKTGDMIFILVGDKKKTLGQLSELRLEMGSRLGLRDKNTFVPLWVIDFPLFEWDEETQRFYAMHHPFTSPKPEDIAFFESDPGNVRANAYDCVVNGVELGGGSIRIHDQQLQQKMFKVLGFSKEQAEYQFGFIMNAFTYGAPPHGGIAFGFDRLVSMFAGLDSIRDVIAFPKNNSGRDMMIDSPSIISDEQLKELNLKVDIKTEK